MGHVGIGDAFSIEHIEYHGSVGYSGRAAPCAAENMGLKVDPLP